MLFLIISVLCFILCTEVLIKSNKLHSSKILVNWTWQQTDSDLKSSTTATSVRTGHDLIITSDIQKQRSLHPLSKVA